MRFAAVRLVVVAVAPVLATPACLPVPSRVRDTPDVSGRLLAATVPLAGFDVSAIRESGPLIAPPTCGAGSLARTDSTGAFHLPPSRHWEFWVALLGESPEWHRAWSLCMRPGNATASDWRIVYRAHSNLWDPVSLQCDASAAWSDTAAPEAQGRCHEESTTSRHANRD